MQAKTRANIELAAQVVIAISVVVAAGVLVKRTFFSAAGRPNVSRINTGEHLNIANVDWEQNQKSLVFFLKKDCPYCTTSAPFYRQLIDEATKRNVKCLAVFPNNSEDARKYLKYVELPIEDVRLGSLPAYKVTGTPTVLFVDHKGIVRGAWFGAAADREQEIRDSVVQLFEASTN